MKPSALKSALETHLNRRAEISDLEDLKAHSETELAALEASCDLQDQIALQKITGLQVLIRLLPTRIAAREDQREAARAALVKAGSAFIEETLRPKLNDLRDAAREKVKKSLAAIFLNKDTLAEAIAKSDLMQSVEAIGNGIMIQSHPHDCGGYINTILQAWERAEEVEKTL